MLGKYTVFERINFTMDENFEYEEYDDGDEYEYQKCECPLFSGDSSRIKEV